ncbi:MAG: DUF4804 domain-containing protein [Rhodobacterales bacterium]|nr:DUF4804 domain-containing protein [Rhodobacterales bacterium]MDX5411537.1 DUF4804 domain-containing protein [Rhodobacterales bacterium]
MESFHWWTKQTSSDREQYQRDTVKDQHADFYPWRIHVFPQNEFRVNRLPATDDSARFALHFLLAELQHPRRKKGNKTGGFAI